MFFLLIGCCKAKNDFHIGNFNAIIIGFQRMETYSSLFIV